MTTISSGADSLLWLDAEEAVAAIAGKVRQQVGETLRRRGAVVAMSGGVDSSVCAALAVQALGPSRVLGLFLPERDSDPISLTLAREWATSLGIEALEENITPTLEGCGCYERRDNAVRRVVPDYTVGWRSKIVLPGNRFASAELNYFSLVVQPPEGESFTVRLPAREYREIVAATNFKQRVRKMLEYFHADRLHYAVLGTPNRLEHDQGFFVKGGDGLADLKPIAHLYKSQVYQLADHLGVPLAITDRPPTTDTYSLPQTQEEFFFSLPARMLDLVLFARESGWSTTEAATRLGVDPADVERAYRDLERKRETTRYLHLTSLLAGSASGASD